MNMESYISPYDWRGLRGRLLHIPGVHGHRQHIILVYGQHASLERLQTLAEALRRYGQVWLPDLPGFGGMDSFYKIGLEASVDNYADYLHDFIVRHIKDEPFVIIGMSYGFANVTRMYQKYPGLQKQTKLLISFVGFTGARDFKITPLPRKLAIHAGTIASKGKYGAALLQLMLRSIFIKWFYTIDWKKRYTADPASQLAMQTAIQQQLTLWRINDCRTHASTAYDFLFRLDLTGVKLQLPVHHLGVTYDHFFDHGIVVKHMKEIYDKVYTYTLDLENHTPSQNTPAAEILLMLPPELQSKLTKLANGSSAKN